MKHLHGKNRETFRGIGKRPWPDSCRQGTTVIHSVEYLDNTDDRLHSTSVAVIVLAVRRGLYHERGPRVQLWLRSTTVMKFAVKSLALGMCVAGATAAFATAHIGTVPMATSHQAVPIPTCSPGAKCTGNGWAVPIPTCSPGAKCTGNGWEVSAVPIPTCSPGAKCTGNGWAVPIPTCSPGAKCTGNGWEMAAVPIPTCSPGAKCAGNGW